MLIVRTNAVRVLILQDGIHYFMLPTAKNQHLVQIDKKSKVPVSTVTTFCAEKICPPFRAVAYKLRHMLIPLFLPLAGVLRV